MFFSFYYLIVYKILAIYVSQNDIKSIMSYGINDYMPLEQKYFFNFNRRKNCLIETYNIICH